MTGNPTLDKIILGLNGIVVAAATAVIIFSHTAIKRPPTDQALEFGNLIEGQINEYQKPPVVMDEIIVNLYSREARLRFLNTKMNLVLVEEKDRTTVLEMKPFIFDILIDIAGNMKPDELNSVTGRLLLETRLKNHINSIKKRPLVKKVLFTKFIIQ